ncbi:hypothetical protein FRB91_010790 [Serendipita sp. 411]|nr:hypothetical protein FRB91_010790 [Serendipita sp. 411]
MSLLCMANQSATILAVQSAEPAAISFQLKYQTILSSFCIELLHPMARVDPILLVTLSRRRLRTLQAKIAVELPDAAERGPQAQRRFLFTSSVVQIAKRRPSKRSFCLVPWRVELVKYLEGHYMVIKLTLFRVTSSFFDVIPTFFELPFDDIPATARSHSPVIKVSKRLFKLHWSNYIGTGERAPKEADSLTKSDFCPQTAPGNHSCLSYNDVRTFLSTNFTWDQMPQQSFTGNNPCSFVVETRRWI